MNEPNTAPIPTPGTRRFTFECLRSGQPRPYADSEYEYIITVEWVPYETPRRWQVNEGVEVDTVRRVARAYCAVAFPEDNPDTFAAIVKSFKKLPDGKWYLLASRLYSD